MNSTLFLALHETYCIRIKTVQKFPTKENFSFSDRNLDFYHLKFLQVKNNGMLINAVPLQLNFKPLTGRYSVFTFRHLSIIIGKMCEEPLVLHSPLSLFQGFQSLKLTLSIVSVKENSGLYKFNLERACLERNWGTLGTLGEGKFKKKTTFGSEK